MDKIQVIRQKAWDKVLKNAGEVQLRADDGLRKMHKLRGILAKAGQDGHSFDMSFKYIKAGCCLDATLTFIITASVKSRIQKTAA